MDVFVLRLFCPNKNSNTVIGTFKKTPSQIDRIYQIGLERGFEKNQKCQVYPKNIAQRELGLIDGESMCVFILYDDDTLQLVSHVTPEERLYPTFEIDCDKNLKQIYITVGVSNEECRHIIERYLNIKSSCFNDV
jgi:hypothetical protein